MTTLLDIMYEDKRTSSCIVYVCVYILLFIYVLYIYF